MAIEVPRSAKRMVPHPHRVVAEHDQLIPDLDFGKLLPPAELSGDLLGSCIVVTLDEEDVLAADSTAVREGVLPVSAAEVAEKVNRVSLGDASIQPCEYLVVHVGYSRERPVAVANDVLMSEVKVGGEPDLRHV